MTASGPGAPPEAASIEYGGIHHVGMLVENTAAAKRFYMDVLGMGDDHALRNPKLPFGGTFVRAGNSQIHLMELPSVDPKVGRPEHGGRCVPPSRSRSSAGQRPFAPPG
jgi:glyoxylase I family protein